MLQVFQRVHPLLFLDNEQQETQCTCSSCVGTHLLSGPLLQNTFAFFAVSDAAVGVAQCLGELQPAWPHGGVAAPQASLTSIARKNLYPHMHGKPMIFRKDLPHLVPADTTRDKV